MRDIYYGSATTKILTYLYNFGDTKRCLLVSTFSAFNRQTIQAATRRLLDGGYIEQYSGKDKGQPDNTRYLSITHKGRAALKEVYETHGCTDELQTLNTAAQMVQDIRGDARKNMVERVLALLTAEGVLVNENEKPSLPLLLSKERAPIDENEKRKIENMQDMGAYYSMTEIRNTAYSLFGQGPLNQTRCIGVLIRHKRIFFLYNMSNRLIMFVNTVEQRTEYIVLTYFQSSRYANELFSGAKSTTAPCILFGETYKCIPQLVYASKKGKKKIDDQGNPVDYGHWEPNVDKLTMQSLLSVYPTTYFIALRHPEEKFSIITDTLPKMVELAAQNWVQTHPEMRLTHDGQVTQAATKDKDERVFIWLDNNLSTLHSLFLSKMQAHVVLSDQGAEEEVSKILGPNLLTIRTLDDAFLNPSRYTSTGHKEKRPE